MNGSSNETGAAATVGYHALDQDEPDLEEQNPDSLSDHTAASDTGPKTKERSGESEGGFIAASKRRCSPARRCAVLLEFVLLAAVLAVALFAALGGRSRHHHAASPENAQEHSNSADRKYTLDSSWDFDAAPQTRSYHWTVHDAERNPDGVYRPMILINAEFPGPMIECNQGDTIVVHVDNKASNSTSLHWHGIYQNGTASMDGTVGITQCPIAPGSSMTYKFTVDGQSGTYWYHAHMATQVSDGLFGPFIIHSMDERALQKIDYATDQVLMVQDYYHDLSSALLPHYLAPDRENAEPVPDGGLINGKNIRNCDDLPNRRCDNSTAGLATLNLERDQSHRLRIIHTGAFAEFQLQLDEHQFAVTEADGTDLWPIYYHRLNINPGQRYSIVITANVTTRDSFWLRAKMVTACFAEENPNLVPEVRAIVRYSSDEASSGESQKPSSTDWAGVVDMQCLDMNTTELRPVTPATPPAADTLIYLRSNFEIGNWRLSRGFFNTSSWRPTLSSPTLHRMVSGYESHNASFVSDAPEPYGINSKAFDPKAELVYQTSGIRTLDILISNFDDGNHPLHLHGYKYFVLASGHGYPPADLHAMTNLSNPLRRDTASVEAFGWILLRLIADNPGLWAFHCHISWHTEAGMLMQLATRTDEVAKLTIPADHRTLCQANGLEKGATPDDSTWFGDFGNFDDYDDEE